MATERVQAAAKALKSSGDVAAAMASAGYGQRFIDGNAATFAAFLHSEGLLTDNQLAKYQPAAAVEASGNAALDAAEARIAELEAALAAAQGDGDEGGE